MSDNSNLADDARSVCLCSVGQPDYSAVTTVAADGTEHLVLAKHDGDLGAYFGWSRWLCEEVACQIAGLVGSL